MEKVSVVIPCYNSEDTIERALNSVKEQTYPIHEVIVVDDCSSDKTYDVILNFIKKNELSVKVLCNNVNSGPSLSRNTGIMAATGDYIAFLDADDFWLPNKTEIQMKFMLQYNMDCVGSSFLIDGDMPFNHENEYQLNLLNLTQLLMKNSLPTPSVIIKKNGYIFDESMKYAEDYDLWLRFSIDNKVIGNVVQPLIMLGKPSYGYSGLSANLIKMEKGEIKAIIKNVSKKNFFLTVFFVLFSFLKFIRRVVKVYFSKLF